MWILPNDNIVREARSGCIFWLGQTLHPEVNLTRWSQEKLKRLGIKRFKEVGFPVDGSTRVTGYTDAYDEETNTLTRTFTTEGVTPTEEETSLQLKAEAAQKLQEQNLYLFEMVLFLWQAIKSKTNLTNADVPAALLDKAQSWQQYLDRLK
jgi:hypothetical protein